MAASHSEIKGFLFNGKPFVFVHGRFLFMIAACLCIVAGGCRFFAPSGLKAEALKALK